MTAPSAPPRLAVIVVHYGDPQATRRCLDSLADLGDAEIILVDQPPTRCGHHALVTTRLETHANLGFAAACNRGVRATEADFVLLLNNDARLAAASADRLKAALPSLAPDVAGACLKILGPDGATLQSAGGLWFSDDGIGFPNGFGETDRRQYDAMAPEAVGVPSGAAALFRRSAFVEAGGMPEDFFCYCEDGDLGLRLVAAGQSFAWLPGVVVHHDLSASSQPHSAFKAFHVERNHFATMIATAPASEIAALPFRTAARLVRTAADAQRGRGAGAGLLEASRPGQLVVTLLRAWLGAAARIPRSLARRRELQGRYPGGTERVGGFLRSHRADPARFARSRDLAGA